MRLRRLPTLAQARRFPVPCPKPRPSGQVRASTKYRAALDWQACRLVVWDQDGHRCRKCGDVVYEPPKATSERHVGHVAHIVSRRDPLVRVDPRNCLLLCPVCHRQIDGTIGERWRVVGTQWFVVGGTRYINGRHPVTFERIV